MDFDKIQHGDKIVIKVNGKLLKGKAVMKSRQVDAWVLNIGGAHGIPKLAFRDNVVEVD